MDPGFLADSVDGNDELDSFTKASRMNLRKWSASCLVDMYPNEMRTEPVGCPFMMSMSSPQTCPAWKRIDNARLVAIGVAGEKGGCTVKPAYYLKCHFSILVRTPNLHDIAGL